MDVGIFLLLSQIPDLIGGVPQNAIQNAASGIFSFYVPFICQTNHLVRQLQGLSDVVIAWFHGASLKEYFSLLRRA
jgi:hypothetical protein